MRNIETIEDLGSSPAALSSRAELPLRFTLDYVPIGLISGIVAIVLLVASKPSSVKVMVYSP